VSRWTSTPGISVKDNYCTQWTTEGYVFGAVSLFLVVYEISLEPLNGFAPNSHRRRVWSLARMSLKVRSKVKGLGHHKQKNGILRPFRRPACGLFGKTSLASSLVQKLLTGHTDTHTEPIALPGPPKWSVTTPHKTIYQIEINSFGWHKFSRFAEIYKPFEWLLVFCVFAEKDFSHSALLLAYVLLACKCVFGYNNVTNWNRWKSAHIMPRSSYVN